jgi:hypothetical protein
LELKQRKVKVEKLSHFVLTTFVVIAGNKLEHFEVVVLLAFVAVILFDCQLFFIFRLEQSATVHSVLNIP